MLKITRVGHGYAVKIVGFIAIYSATSARDPQREALLGKTLAAGALTRVNSVRRDEHDLEDSCALRGRVLVWPIRLKLYRGIAPDFPRMNLSPRKYLF
jgi:hypothetical protein